VDQEAIELLAARAANKDPGRIDWIDAADPRGDFAATAP
jgi:hypothetical protein